MRVLIVGAKIA